MYADTGCLPLPQYFCCRSMTLAPFFFRSFSYFLPSHGTQNTSLDFQDTPGALQCGYCDVGSGMYAKKVSGIASGRGLLS